MQKTITVNGLDFPVLRYGMVLSFGTFGRRFSFGTISGYSASYNEFGDKVLEKLMRAADRGHKTVWVNEQATIISDPPTVPDEIELTLNDGDTVFIDSTWAAERGWWQVKHTRFEGWHFVRPTKIIELWTEQSGSFRQVFPSEVSDHVTDFLRDGHSHITMVAHDPWEYTLSGYAEHADHLLDPRD